MEHVGYARQPALVANAYSALKPGGLFVMTTPNREVNRKLGIVGKQPVEDWLTLDEAVELVGGAFDYTQAYPLPNRLLDALWQRLFHPVNMYLV